MRAQQDNRAFSNSPRAPLNMIQSVYTPTTTKSPKITYPHHTRQFSQNNPRLPTGLELERINTEPVYTSASDVRGYNVDKIPGQIKQFENFFQKNLNHLTEHGLKNINYDTLDHLACYAQSSKSRVYTEDQEMMLQFTNKTRTDPNPKTPKISLQPLLSNSPRHILALSTLRSPDTSEERRFIDQPQTVRTPNEKKSNSKLKTIEKNIGSVSYRGTSSLTSQDFVQDLYKSKKGENQKKTNYSAKVAKKTSELEALIGGPGGHRKRGYSNNDKKTAPQCIFSPAEKNKMANMPSIEKNDAQPVQSVLERKDSIIENNSESNNATQVMSGEGFPAKQGKFKTIHHSISGIEEIRKEQDKSVSSIYTEKPEKKKKVILKKTSSVSSGLRKSSSGSPKDPQSDNSLKTIDIDQDKTRMMKKLWINTDNPELIGTQSSLDDKGSTRLQTNNISTISTTKHTQMTMSDLFMPTAAVISEPLNLVFSSERVQSLPDELPKSTGFKIKKLPLKNNSTFKHMKSSVADESDADLSSKSKEEPVMRKISAGTPIAQEETATLQIEKAVSEPTKLLVAQEPQFPQFDFQKKTMEVHFKHKKHPMRRSSVTIDPTIFDTRTKHDFGAEFNSTVNTVVQKLYGSAKNPSSVSKIQGKTLSRGVTSDMEGLLRKESEEGVGRLPTRISKNNVSESEFASTIIRLPTRLSEGPSEIIADPPIKEDGVTPSNRVYPVKNYIITVNINPPIEEASPRMEESLIPPGSFSSHLDAFEFGHMKNDEIAMGQSAGTISNLSRQYKFELNTKKHVEELIEEEKSIFGDADMSIMMNEQPFRNNAESLFKYEEIQSYMTYWASIKTLTSVTKANFFAFVEKIMLEPVHQKSNLCVFEEAYFTDIQKSNSAGSQNLFRYRPKTKDIMFNFIDEIYASLKGIIDNCSSNDAEEKFEAFEIKGKGSILPTSIMIVKEVTPAMLTPQLIRLDVAALKRIKESYTFLDLFKFLCEGEALQHLKQDYAKLVRMERNMNLVNWKYAMKFFNRLYGSVLFGTFETTMVLLKEDIQVKIEKKTGQEEEEPLPEKKRRVPRSATSRAGDFQSNGARILKAATKSIINSLRNSPKSANTSGEQKCDFATQASQASDEKQGPPSLNLQYTQFKRRYSKTTIKPFTTLGAKESLSVERTNTMFVRKQSTMTTTVDKQNSLLPNQANVRKQVSAFTNIEKQISLIPNQGTISKGVTLAISDENGMDTSSNQLQIPTETHLANLAKIQSLPANNKDDNKSKFSNERSRSRKNIFATGNTINTSTRKSLSTNSDSQIQNSAQDVAVVVRPRALSKEPSYSTLFPPKVKGPSIVNPNPAVKLISMKTKEGDSLIMSRTPSPQQTVKNVITKMNIVNTFSENAAAHKKRHTVRVVLEESGPRKAMFYSIGNRNYQEVQGMLDMNPREMINNVRDENGDTLLISAVKSGKKQIVSLLIDREVEIDAQNEEGNTALHVAIMHGLDDIADILLQSGAKQTFRNNKGKICWEMVNYR